jgi:hypothetical protein
MKKILIFAAFTATLAVIWTTSLAQSSEHSIKDLERAFDRAISSGISKDQKCNGIVSVVAEYMNKGYSGGEIYQGYDYIDRKYPGLIDSCDK